MRTSPSNPSRYARYTRTSKPTNHHQQTNPFAKPGLSSLSRDLRLEEPAAVSAKSVRLVEGEAVTSQSCSVGPIGGLVNPVLQRLLRCHGLQEITMATTDSDGTFSHEDPHSCLPAPI